MSHSGHHLNPEKIACMAGGAAELLKHGGYMHSQAGHTVHRVLTGTHTGHMAAGSVQSLARYAPAAVAAMGAVAPPVAIAAGVAYGGYRLFQWLKHKW